MGERTYEPVYASRFDRQEFVRSNPVLAMPRDASWERCPSTTSGGQYHVVDTSTLRARCGQPMMPDDDRAVHLEQVEQWQRCKRNGCRQAWPKEPRHDQ